MHWEKLEAVDHTVWATTDETGNIVDELYHKGILEEVEQIFAAKEIKPINGKKKSQEEKVTFLKSDITQQFGINLHSFSNESVEFIIDRILECHPDITESSNILEFLAKPELTDITDTLARKFQPYSTEWGIDQKFPEKDPHDLARADRIYLELCINLQHYWKARMRSSIVISSFRRDYEDLVAKLDAIDIACEAIKNSKSFKKILEIILAVGNFMNDSSKQASGFKLGTLQRLVFTKDDKNIMTFLHYVEKIVRTAYPEAENFIDELKDTFNVAKISIDQLKADCNEFMQKIQNCQSSVDIGNLSDPSRFHPKDKILAYVLASLPEARTKRENLRDQMNVTVDEFTKLMRFYGEDPTDLQSSTTFFAKFVNFINEYKRVRQENLQRETENRAYEARKKLAESKKSDRDDGMTESKIDTSKSNAVMDTLLEKLRAAGPSNDPKGARRRAAARKSLADHRRILSRSHEETQISLASVKPVEKDSDLQSDTPNNSSEAITAGEEEITENNNESNVDDRRGSLVPPKIRRTSVLRNSSITNGDDVGGRARQLLEELRKSSTTDDSVNSGNSSNYHSRSLSGSSSSKLAEMRARHENRRRSSQFYAENSHHLRPAPEKTLTEEKDAEKNNIKHTESQTSTGKISEVTVEDLEDQPEITEVVEKQEQIEH